LSAAATLSEHASVVLLEAEEQAGYHSSGRSATMLHYALGNPLVRALTLASRQFIESPPERFSETPLGHTRPTLVHAREEELPALNALAAAIAPFATLERVGEKEILDLCPVLRVGRQGAVAALVDRNAIKLDSDALLQGFARTLRHNGGDMVTGARVQALNREKGAWTAVTERGDRFSAPVVVNAADRSSAQAAHDHYLRRAGRSRRQRVAIRENRWRGALLRTRIRSPVRVANGRGA
jgi:D-arginine dehydrogenase